MSFGLSKHAQRTYANRGWLGSQLRVGRSREKIARAAGVSVMTVTLWKGRLGFNSVARVRRFLSPHARATYANRQWLEVRLRRGWTHGRIARAARSSLQTIRQWVRRLGLSTGGTVSYRAMRTYANRRWLSREVYRGASDDVIAHRAGCASPTIAKWRKQFGLPSIRRPHPPNRRAEREKIARKIAPRLSRAELTDEEREVLESFFGIGGKMLKLKDIAGPFGVSTQRIGQIKNSALAKVQYAGPA